MVLAVRIVDNYIVSCLLEENRLLEGHENHSCDRQLELVCRSLQQNSILVTVIRDSRFDYPCLIFLLK